MKQRNRWVAVLTVWTIALLFASGFTSQTSVSGSGMVQKEDTEYNAGAGTIAAVLEKIPLEAVEQTKAKAEEAAQEERRRQRQKQEKGRRRGGKKSGGRGCAGTDRSRRSEASGVDHLL